MEGGESAARFVFVGGRWVEFMRLIEVFGMESFLFQVEVSSDSQVGKVVETKH